MPLAAKSKAWHYPLKFTSSEQQSQLLVLPSPDNTPHASSSPFTSSVALSWMLLGTLASPYSTAHDIQGETALLAAILLAHAEPAFTSIPKTPSPDLLSSLLSLICACALLCSRCRTQYPLLLLHAVADCPVLRSI